MFARAGRLGMRRVTMSGAIPFRQVAQVQTSYTTNFPLTEIPMSEAGRWTSWGIDPPRTDAQTIAGSGAFGTMDSFDGINFPDSGATLTGVTFSPNHSIQGTFANNGAGSLDVEAEHVLRSNVSDTAQSGYESDWVNSSKELNYVRLNGPDNDFTIASGFPVTTNVSMNDGDVAFSSINGSFVNVTCNSLAVVTNLDIRSAFGGGLVIDTGYPGVGFWNATGSSANRTKLGWKNFTARDLSPP